MEINKRKCLVTGGNGSFGRSLTKELISRNYIVNILDIKKPFNNLFEEEEKNGKVKIFIGDLKNKNDIRKACEGVQIIFHTASLVDTTRIGFFKQHYENIILAAQNLLEIIQELGTIEILINTSTHNVVFENKEIILDHYGKAKCIAEKIIIDANGMILPNKKKLLTCSIRPGIIWGPDDSHSRRFIAISSLYTPKPPSNVEWDFVYIRNLSHANILAAEKLLEEQTTKKYVVAGQCYFIGEPKNNFEHWNKFVIGMGRKSMKLAIPKFMFIIFGWFCEILNFIIGPFYDIRGYWWFMTVTEAQKLCTTHTFTCEKAKKELGYQPIVNYEEGLKETIHFWRKKLKENEKKRIFPSFYWWFLILTGIFLLSVVAFHPNPIQSYFYHIPLFPFFFQFQNFWKLIFFLTILAHLLESFYVIYLLIFQKQTICPEKLSQYGIFFWWLQTMILGGPSIYTLTHPRNNN